MNDIAMSAEKLGKMYRIGGRQTRHDRLTERVMDTLAAPIQRLRNLGQPAPEEEIIWALKNVSFEVRRGEVVGIIGRNGAGKSTLLKILSRITEPTEGRVEIRGRVGSLLEVGTGFHPELTGRENVYLNGAILGMRRGEIERKFDEIVDFSGVEKFIDTVVKRYSSGMRVRLGFAVAAHLEPEVLLVDEVLAVGDVAFQRKCLGKMGSVAREGRTVLFVSHNMAAIQNLCQRGIVLDQGRIVFAGTQIEAVAEYLRSLDESKTPSLRDREDRTGSGEVRGIAIEARDISGSLLDAVTCGQDVDIHLHFEAIPGFCERRLTVGLRFETFSDVRVFLHHNRLARKVFGELPPSGAFVCRLKRLPLPPSTYRIHYSIMIGGRYLDRINDAVRLTVVDGDFFGAGEVPPITQGVCLVEGDWRLEGSAFRG